MTSIKQNVWLIVFRNLNAFFVSWSSNFYHPLNFVTFNVLREHRNYIVGGRDNKSHTIIHIRIFLRNLFVYELVLSSSMKFKLSLLLNLVYCN